MKNKDIYDLYEGLTIIGQDKELKFDAKTSFYLARNKNLIEPYYNAIVETRRKLLDKYGEPEEGGNWFVPKEKVEEFTREWDSFMNIENIVNLQKISVEDFKSQINIKIMGKLLSIIEE
jgi:hypothetical protein